MDDLTIFGKDINKINQLKQDLRTEFELNDLGDIAYYLGLKVRRNRAARTITLSQESYIDSIIKSTFDKITRKKVNIPITDAAKDLRPADLQPSKAFLKQYQRIVGKIMYLSLETRPDIAYAISTVSQFSHTPTEEAMTAAKRIMRYIGHTREYSITYGGIQDTKITAYCDAN